MILHQVDGGSDGHGNGYGYGNGTGYGNGSYGEGDGYGTGYGDGDGDGDGYGCTDPIVAPCVSQMYLLAAMVNRSTLIPNVQELTNQGHAPDNQGER